MQEIFTATRIMLSLSFLLYSSWSDYKTREVSNRVWILYAPVALALILAELLLYEPARLPFLGLSFGITAIIAVLLFYVGGFGGADSKALMCIALALPFSVGTVIPLNPLGESPLAQNIFPLTVFSNGVLFAAATAVYMFLYNIIWHLRTGKKFFEGTLTQQSLGKKLLVMITGHRVSLQRLKDTWHIYPLEDIQETNSIKRTLLTVPKDEGRTEIVTRLSKAAETRQIDEYVWATPGLPMLIFLTAGLIVALLFGDIVWILISAILR